MKKRIIFAALLLSLSSLLISSCSKKEPQPIIIDYEMRNACYEVTFADQDYQMKELDTFNFELKAGASQNKQAYTNRKKINKKKKANDYQETNQDIPPESLPIIELHGVDNYSSTTSEVLVTYDFLETGEITCGSCENVFIAYSKDNGDFEKFTGEKTFSETGSYIIAAHNSRGNSYCCFMITGPNFKPQIENFYYLKVSITLTTKNKENRIYNYSKKISWMTMPPENWRTENIITTSYYDNYFDIHRAEFLSEEKRNEYIYNSKNELKTTNLNQIKTTSKIPNRFRLFRDFPESKYRISLKQAFPISSDEKDKTTIIEYISAEYTYSLDLILNNTAFERAEDYMFDF